jgi:hypothetical protein
MEEQGLELSDMQQYQWREALINARSDGEAAAERRGQIEGLKMAADGCAGVAERLEKSPIHVDVDPVARKGAITALETMAEDLRARISELEKATG